MLECSAPTSNLDNATWLHLSLWERSASQGRERVVRTFSWELCQSWQNWTALTRG